jgi:hypothetical protein
LRRLLFGLRQAHDVRRGVAQSEQLAPVCQQDLLDCSSDPWRPPSL